MNFRTATFRRFSAKATQLAVARRSRSSTRRVAAPPGLFVGRDALDKFAADLRATHPHFAYTPHGEPQAVQNAGRLAWGSGLRGQEPGYTGLDVIAVRGDKIAALYIFLDSKLS
jgi:hypothetical protein